jgi:hypothetical protein
VRRRAERRALALDARERAVRPATAVLPETAVAFEAASAGAAAFVPGSATRRALSPGSAPTALEEPDPVWRPVGEERLSDDP